MDFSRTMVIFLWYLLLFRSLSTAGASFRPKALVLPVSKDSSTLQYVTHINQRTPVVPVKLTLDLGGQFLWVDCEQGYVSSSYKQADCNSAQCSLANANVCTSGGSCNPKARPGCSDDTCGLSPINTVTRTGSVGEVAMDIVTIQSTDGSNPGRVVSVPNFIFTCASTFLLEGLASGVKGMAGLGRTNISLPSQFSSAFSSHRTFAICLSSSTNAKGVVFFGNGPYVLLPNVDVSQSLIYTPLILNPVSTAIGYFEDEPSTEYFIGVKSIKINGKAISLNTSLLSIDSKGYGGTKISTVDPYTVMETTIYNSFTSAFVKELANVSRVAPIAPFGACFNSTNIHSTRLGPAVPPIDFVLQSSNIYWRVFGANSMVQVRRDVLCLGIVDGGVHPRTSIVIGGYQLENNLFVGQLSFHVVQLDLKNVFFVVVAAVIRAGYVESPVCKLGIWKFFGLLSTHAS